VGDERPPPPITLTDPLHPGPLHDVVFQDSPELWRPSRRQLTVLAAAVVVVVAAVSPYLAIRDRRIAEDRRVAAASVSLLDASDGDRGRTTSPPDFTLANRSQETLRLVSATLEDYDPVPLDATMRPGTTAAVTVPLPHDCPGVLPESRPGVMAVTYVVRGRQKTTLLNVTGTYAAYAFRDALQARCLLYRVEEAVRGSVYVAARQARSLRLHVAMENVGPQATELRAFEFVSGFRVARTSLPVPRPLAAAESFERTGRLELDVDMEVSDCQAARAFLATYATAFLPRMTAELEGFSVELEFAGAPVLGDLQAVVDASC
jgi:hypothetical protein